MTKRALFLLAATLLAATTVQSRAGDAAPEPYKEVAPPDNFPYEHGTWDLQGLAGGFWSFTPDSTTRKTINYAEQAVRLGYMFTTPKGKGFFRGNLEMLLEAFGGEAYWRDHGGLAGGSLLFRYNFVQPGAKWIPYLQLGGGALGNDIWLDQKQREVGEAFEFDLQGHLGLEYLVTHNTAITLEGGYTHISNASLSERNVGLDALGGYVAFNYFF